MYHPQVGIRAWFMVVQAAPASMAHSLACMISFNPCMGPAQVIEETVKKTLDEGKQCVVTCFQVGV